MSEKREVDECPSEEASSQAESFDASKSGTSETYDMKDFCPGIRIEAKDFDGKWYPAKVSDVDWTENEILVHFENWNTKFDEWIPMDSSRLRPIQKPVSQQKDVIKFSKGEEVMAVWSANQKYPGVIQAVLANDRYDVLFSDGFLKRLKAHKISKIQGEIIKPEVKTFTDIGTKEERRERKRKINVAELFHINKRSKKKGLVNSKTSDIKTYPVSKSRAKSSVVKKLESFEENPEKVANPQTKEVKHTDEKPVVVGSSGGSKALIDNIPAAFEVKYLNGQTEMWSKQLYQRSEGRTAGKLDIVILNPQGRKFRSRNEIMKYCEENGILYTHESFDFSAKGRPKSKPVLQTPPVKSELSAEEKDKSNKRGSRRSQNDFIATPQNPVGILPQNEMPTPENVTPNKVFIGDYEVVIENGKFICPVKICGKHFRRENLLHMHMKHYHPEFSKYLDYTPSVTDLAYARTVGNLDAVETPPPAPRKISAPEKSDKSSVRVDNLRRPVDVSPESAKDAKKLKLSDTKIEGKSHSVKPLTEVSATSVASAEESNEESQKNKPGSTGSQLGKSTSSINESESGFQETSESLSERNSNEQPSRDGESSASSSVVKSSRHARLHCRKKSNRFQGSFSDHIRKRRFISQDRSRHHNRSGRQQQSQLPGQQFPPSQQPLQTISPQPSVEDTNSNSLSQGQAMTRYLKPHLNLSNEISGKNNLLTRYKTISPGSEDGEACSGVVANALDKVGKRNNVVCNRRSYLTGLINARKRKRKAIRKRWKKRKREQARRSLQSFCLNETRAESKTEKTEALSGRKENTEKPDADGIKNRSQSNNSCETDKKCQNVSTNKISKPKINDPSRKKLESNVENKKTDPSESILKLNKNCTNTTVKPKDIPEVKDTVSSKNSSQTISSEPKIKSKIDAKDLPRAYVLLENIYGKCKTTHEKGNENIRRCPYSDTVSRQTSHRRDNKKKKRKSLENCRLPSQKRVRFETTVLEKWIDEGETFHSDNHGETSRREERKNKQKKLQLNNEYLNKNEVNLKKRSDDSSRDENCSNKTRSLDQAEVTEDSKSPVATENDKVEKLRRNEIINCLCGITEEDGLMIQCDICLCWQHGHCAGILRELDVPDKYTCAICKNPFRGRSSMKYQHDQEWLKEGTLPSLTFRSKRNDIIEQRKTILKRSHDLSGSITLLSQVIHSLRIKVNIAEKKDHPKLWLWAKKWTEKKPNRLKEESEVKEERTEEQSIDLGNEVKKEEGSQDEKQLPKAPEPEAPIDSAECRLNLLDHLIHYQSLIDDRLSCIESLVAELESMQDDAVNDETPDRYPRTKATVQMILRDLNTMKKIATI